MTTDFLTLNQTFAYPESLLFSIGPMGFFCREDEQQSNLDVRKDTEHCIFTKVETTLNANFNRNFSTKRAAILSVLPPDDNLFLTFYLLYQGLVIVEKTTFLVSDFQLLTRSPCMKTYFVNSSIK